MIKTFACTLFVIVNFVEASAAAELTSKPTFTRDIAPILYDRCSECHRAGQVAPRSLLTYGEVRPWAKSIQTASLQHSVPPWLADSRYGSFGNDRRLQPRDIRTIAAWIEAGAPEGGPSHLPSLPQFEEGWTSGKPDAVTSPEKAVEVPAQGVMPYAHYRVSTNFQEDQWVQAAEIRPGNPAAVPAGKMKKLCGFAPGEQPKVHPPLTAKLVKTGSDFIFQMYYTPNGKAAVDRSYVGLIFSQEPVRTPVMTGTALNTAFRIPSGDPNCEVRSSFTAKEDLRLVDLMPHMHLRGKDFRFNWQLVYRLQDPLLLPPVTRLECVAHFDNSLNNKYNPAPGKEVRWGDQTWEEMMMGWFDYTVESQSSRADNRPAPGK